MYYLARLDSSYLPYGIEHSTNGTFYSYSFAALFATYGGDIANSYKFISSGDSPPKKSIITAFVEFTLLASATLSSTLCECRR